MLTKFLEVNIFLKPSVNDNGDFKINDNLSIGIEVKNISSQSIWIIGVLDGSETGQRYPHYIPKVTGPIDISSMKEWTDFTSPLRRKNFQLLEPGEGFDPTSANRFFPLVAFHNFVPSVPGRYSFSLMLSTHSKRDEEWLGTLPDDEQVGLLSLIANIPRCTLKSNVLEVDVF